jgi:hypothetical protein
MTSSSTQIEDLFAKPSKLEECLNSFAGKKLSLQTRNLLIGILTNDAK